MHITPHQPISVVKRHRRVAAISSLMMVSLFLPLLNTANADITIDDFKFGSCGICSVNVRIQGDIKKSDLETLKQRIADAPNRCNEVQIIAQLDSRGGDIEAAMGIGRLFRKHETQVKIEVEGSCYSACIFLLAGAVERFAFMGNVMKLSKSWVCPYHSWGYIDHIFMILKI